MRYILLGLGYLCVALGVLGMALPLLPTTPFILLASYLFFRSSPRAQQWLLSNRLFGEMIRNYQINRAIPLHAKIYSLTLLWLTITSSALFFIDNWWIRLLLLVVAVGVTIHISSYKTIRKNDENRLNK